MDPAAQQQAMQMVQQLADALRIGSGQVFGWAVKQAILYGVADLALPAVLLIATILIARIQAKEENRKDTMFFGTAASLLIGFVPAIYGIFRLLNPEWWALRDLIHMVWK